MWPEIAMGLAMAMGKTMGPVTYNAAYRRVFKLVVCITMANERVAMIYAVLYLDRIKSMGIEILLIIIIILILESHDETLTE